MSDVLPPDAADRIDRLCDDFERAWKDGQAPDIAVFLPRIGAMKRGQ